MASIKFYLEPSNKRVKIKDEELRIIGRFSFDRDHRFQIKTDERIQSKHWDLKSQQVKSTYRGHYENYQLMWQRRKRENYLTGIQDSKAVMRAAN